MQFQDCRHLSEPGWKDHRKKSSVEIMSRGKTKIQEVSCYNKVKVVTKETKVSYHSA